ncbi:MAG TPA: hypothetical protein DCP06_02910 [Lachnospiraceae bacterium]|nr:hypothetical protein [Lachnospiraceae bacterium]
MWIKIPYENNLINTDRARRISVKRAAGNGAKSTFKVIVSTEAQHYTLFASDKEAECAQVLDEIFTAMDLEKPTYVVPMSKLKLSR